MSLQAQADTEKRPRARTFANHVDQTLCMEARHTVAYRALAGEHHAVGIGDGAGIIGNHYLVTRTRDGLQRLHH